MSDYFGLNLKTLLKQKGENATKNILSFFSCPKNPNVEYFLKNSAIEFSKQGISNTHLIMTQDNKHWLLLGYYTLTIKIFHFAKSTIPSKTWERRLSKFGRFDTYTQCYSVPIPLIAQLGKNFAIPTARLIPGAELLKLALDKVEEVQSIIGGKLVCLECENSPKLIDFYSENGFIHFGISNSQYDSFKNTSENSLSLMLKYTS